MQYDKNNHLIKQETKTDFININSPKNDIMPTVMPAKIKKEYLYAAGIAFVLIILINNK